MHSKNGMKEIVRFSHVDTTIGIAQHKKNTSKHKNLEIEEQWLPSWLLDVNATFHLHNAHYVTLEIMTTDVP